MPYRHPKDKISVNVIITVMAAQNAYIHKCFAKNTLLTFPQAHIILSSLIAFCFENEGANTNSTIIIEIKVENS